MIRINNKDCKEHYQQKFKKATENIFPEVMFHTNKQQQQKP